MARRWAWSPPSWSACRRSPDRMSQSIASLGSLADPAVVGTAFEHRQSAHCESGVISALLRHAGLPMSEPMAFGVSSGLTFAYVPLVKFGGMPLIAYRMPPRFVIRGLTKRLGIKMAFETFRDPD